MKHIQTFWVQGSTRTVQGSIKHCKFTFFGAALALLLLTSASVRAAQAITQLEFIQWLVQVSGDSSQFNGSSSSADYVQWAQSKGVAPSGGWNPSATLTKDVLAQTLVQLLNLSTSAKSGADYERILAREGIPLPDSPQITRGVVASLLGDLNPQIAGNTGSPVRRPNNGLGNGQQPPPPHNPNGDPHYNDAGNSGHPAGSPHNH